MAGTVAAVGEDVLRGGLGDVPGNLEPGVVVDGVQGHPDLWWDGHR
ncbi:hypothetical protein [Kineococcus terrestris]